MQQSIWSKLCSINFLLQIEFRLFFTCNKNKETPRWLTRDAALNSNLTIMPFRYGALKILSMWAFVTLSWPLTTGLQNDVLIWTSCDFAFCVGRTYRTTVISLTSRLWPFPCSLCNWHLDRVWRICCLRQVSRVGSVIKATFTSDLAPHGAIRHRAMHSCAAPRGTAVIKHVE